MSRHMSVSRSKGKKWVFGWNPERKSFYLQVLDLLQKEKVLVSLGATKKTRMRKIEELSSAASKTGLYLDFPMRAILLGEQLRNE